MAAIFFPELARAQCDWSRVLFFQGDERAVPADDPESNDRIARALWLIPAAVPAANVHRMPAEDPDPERAARAYEALLTRSLGTPARLDIALVGVGPDGHVCSLFPGHAALQARGWTVDVEDAPKPPPRRVSLTMPTLAAAELVVVVALGAGKAAVMREALSGTELPVARALSGARRAVVLLDPDAAGALG